MTALLFDATTDGPLWAAALGCIIVVMGAFLGLRWRREDADLRERRRLALRRLAHAAADYPLAVTSDDVRRAHARVQEARRT